MCLSESLSFFNDDGIPIRSIAEKEKGGIYYVSKPEEVWHLVSRPCGVTLSVALFGKGRRVETPLSPILIYFESVLFRARMYALRPEPDFYGIFFCFLLYY